MLCPFCQKQTQRILGAIVLSAPQEFEKGEATAAEQACNACLALIAQLLDTWREGGINNFKSRAISAGVLKEIDEYVEAGSRPFR